MTYNNNLSVLPFYNSLDEQNHRKPYAYGSIYPLYAHINSMLPFQIIRTTRDVEYLMATLYTKEGNYVADITSALQSAGLQVVRFESLGYDVIVFPASDTTLENISVGQYYLKLTDGVEEWYSDVITLVSDITGYLTIEWYNRENVVFEGGQIVYVNPTFSNRLYLCTELGKPEYVFNEEGEERDGVFFPEKQISEKVYKFQFLASEALCDCMRFIRMSDVVIIRDKYGHYYRCDQFLMTPEWQTQGDLASVEVEFHTDTIVKKIGTGYVVELGGDYNHDYNEDFDR